jgi:hypothetical protein
MLRMFTSSQVCILHDLNSSPSATIPIRLSRLMALKTGLKGITGCMDCLFGIHFEKEPNRFQLMKETRPKLYHYCLDKLELRKVLDYMKIPYIRASKEDRDDTVAILGLHPSILRVRMHKLGIVCPETKEPD